MRAEKYQWAVIILLIIAVIFGSIFVHREVFPEYKEFQKRYVEIEQFRSSYTGEPPPPFKLGVKQIVIPRADNGPEVIDRCISCHVALTIPAFSPTKVTYDADGHLVVDANGMPVKVPNENYIWRKLDDKVSSLMDETENKKLIDQGKRHEVDARLREADDLDALKYLKIGDRWYYMTKLLAMHPLIGKETRPFEFHPMDDYGCVSCHNGNGRALTVERAHGPVFDGQYDAEFEGPKPKFTDTDPNNDPTFSRVFNHKPGHELLFQTTPIFVGKLIQAKCLQCHQVTNASLVPLNTEIKAEDIDTLTSEFHKGEVLFLTQACYACHRISAFSRGGVGPELTKAGNAYPWYIKQKIVWPQSTLKTSTMPNMKLDHQEIESLMTFLLAQTGKNKSMSDYEYQAVVKGWEAGKKASWEKPIEPDKLHDLNFAMTIFASEGCASCHKLVGYTSPVGFEVEISEKKTDFDALYKEREWFKKLFPEEATGTQIVQSLDQFGSEVDKRIVDNTERLPQLEELEKSYPGILESFYSNFEYALRAKNYFYESEAYYAANPQKKAEALKKLDLWKKRVRRVMMMYIQEYGLGRLIGPRLNWSGIFRTDKWLMDHFRNPSSTSPRTIMPAFPFDESKFYALTFMLDVLGVRNRQIIQNEWQQRGFDPEMAYAIHCAQCHGPFKHGNGPVSEWIYPVPKDLSSATFLQNLTKKRATESITHGVIGTPMAPWGEVAAGKEESIPGPVLTKNQIAQLVEWLFFSVQGQENVEDSQDVLKWQYTPEKALEELRKEGSKLKSSEEKEMKSPLLSLLPRGEGYYASLEPQVTRDDKLLEVEDVFDIKSPLVLGGVDQHAYYIKRKYYTEENLREGRRLFEENCAICHGKEADGTGLRAETMRDAKPRMLINLNWLEKRDDLRLLRSIKYGVPGTSMTPWGDFTSTLQRMQMVMFIRSLSAEHLHRESLLSQIYQVFDPSFQALNEVHADEYRDLDSVQNKINDAKKQRQAAYDQLATNAAADKEALKAYEEELALHKKLQEYQHIDELVTKMRELLKKEETIYNSIGLNMLLRNLEGHDFLLLVDINATRYRYENHQLSMISSAAKTKEIQIQKDEIGKVIDTHIAKFQEQIRIIEGQLTSQQREKELANVTAQMNAFKQLKMKFEAEINEAAQLQLRQQNLFKQFQEAMKSPSSKQATK